MTPGTQCLNLKMGTDALILIITSGTHCPGHSNLPHKMFSFSTKGYRACYSFTTVPSVSSVTQAGLVVQCGGLSDLQPHPTQTQQPPILSHLCHKVRMTEDDQG